MVGEWVELNGWLCRGWGRKPHYSERLTVDHIVPISHGGLDVIENCRVLCRDCNSYRGRKPDPIIPSDDAPSWGNFLGDDF